MCLFCLCFVFFVLFCFSRTSRFPTISILYALILRNGFQQTIAKALATECNSSLCQVFPQEQSSPLLQGDLSWASNVSEKYFENHKLLCCIKKWGDSNSVNGCVIWQLFHFYLFFQSRLQCKMFGCRFFLADFSSQILRTELFPGKCSLTANQNYLLILHQKSSVSVW